MQEWRVSKFFSTSIAAHSHIHSYSSSHSHSHTLREQETVAIAGRDARPRYAGWAALQAGRSKRIDGRRNHRQERDGCLVSRAGACEELSTFWFLPVQSDLGQSWKAFRSGSPGPHLKDEVDTSTEFTQASNCIRGFRGSHSMTSPSWGSHATVESPTMSGCLRPVSREHVFTWSWVNVHEFAEHARVFLTFGEFLGYGAALCCDNSLDGTGDLLSRTRDRMHV